MALTAAASSMRSAASSSSRLAPRQRQQLRRPRRLAAQPRPTAATSAPLQDTTGAGHHHGSSSSNYAVVRLGGVRQVLQEGLLFTCPKQCLLELPQAAAAAAGTQQQQQQQRSFVLGNVLGARSGGTFAWGHPFLAGAAVEVELLEEFPGMLPSAAAAAADVVGVMVIFRVSQIVTAQQQHLTE